MNHLARQVKFDYWANLESLHAIERAKIDSPASKIVSHIAAVSELWLARLEKSSPSLKIWPELSTKAIEEIFRDQRRRWLVICETNSAEMPVQYISSAKGECVNNLGEVIQEVALHGAHHRGQIALLLRSHGADPPASTDFIPALRDGRF